MSIYKTLAKIAFLAVFLLYAQPAHAFGDANRYFIKTQGQLLKKTLDVRHEFKDGFSANLSAFQIYFARMMGAEVIPVKVFQITEKKQNQPHAPSLSDQTPWGIEAIYNDTLVVQTSGGDGILVAVLDTGVNTKHKDLANRIKECKDFTNNRMPVADGCADQNGHGTHVAGIIAADAGDKLAGLYGVAPRAELLVYKVCNAQGSCYADDIAQALKTAADRGAKIVNMSFGSDTESSLIREGLDYSSAKDVLAVAAAGNDGPFSESIDYPAAYEDVIAVGALDQTLTVPQWSSRGADVELAAPGDSILSTWKDGGYETLSGTSMAAPFISGLAAKYWAVLTNPSSDSVREQLHISAQQHPLVGDPDAVGYGMPTVSF